MAGAAGPLSVAATGFKAFGSVMQGFNNASNARARGQDAYFSDMMSAEQSQIAAQAGDLKAAQTDDIMRQQLGAALGNVRAVMASANVTGSSPTDSAILNRTEQVGDDARAQRVNNIRMQANMDRIQSTAQLFAGQRALSESDAVAKQSIANGIMGGVGSILGGLSGIKWS